MPKPLNPLADFLGTPEPPDLGPGPRLGVRPERDLARELDRRLAPLQLHPDHQNLVRALILLWHDHLDPAHRLAQDVPGADGAFVHGIMHRREPDYSNAAYWFRRVGTHPCYRDLCKRAAHALESAGAHALLGKILHADEWDPFAFIAACEQAQAGSNPSDRQLLRIIQQIEFEVLLNHLAACP